MMIDTVKLCGWIDNKFSQTKNSTYDFREKLAVYNTLIELQEFMKADLDRQIEELKEANNGIDLYYRWKPRTEEELAEHY